jgi:hypothetical protein
MTESVWKKFFLGWPADMPRRGILVASFGDQVPFAGFMTSEAFLLVERATPDAVGARLVVLPYDQILAVKITEVVKSKSLRAIGFEGEAPKG